jgi:hypothetical protein
VTNEENEKEYLEFITVEPGKPGQILKWDGEQYKWVSPDEHLIELKAEFGTTGNVRWLDEDQVTAYDSEGNICLCKCGKKSASTLYFMHSQIHYCKDCFKELTK